MGSSTGSSKISSESETGLQKKQECGKLKSPSRSSCTPDVSRRRSSSMCLSSDPESVSVQLQPVPCAADQWHVEKHDKDVHDKKGRGIVSDSELSAKIVQSSGKDLHLSVLSNIKQEPSNFEYSSVSDKMGPESEIGCSKVLDKQSPCNQQSVDSVTHLEKSLGERDSSSSLLGVNNVNDEVKHKIERRGISESSPVTSEIARSSFSCQDVKKEKQVQEITIAKEHDLPNLSVADINKVIACIKHEPADFESIAGDTETQREEDESINDNFGANGAKQTSTEVIKPNSSGETNALNSLSLQEQEKSTALQSDKLEVLGTTDQIGSRKEHSNKNSCSSEPSRQIQIILSQIASLTDTSSAKENTENVVNTQQEQENIPSQPAEQLEKTASDSPNLFTDVLHPTDTPSLGSSESHLTQKNASETSKCESHGDRLLMISIEEEEVKEERKAIEEHLVHLQIILQQTKQAIDEGITKLKEV